MSNRLAQELVDQIEKVIGTYSNDFTKQLSNNIYKKLLSLNVLKDEFIFKDGTNCRCANPEMRIDGKCNFCGKDLF